MLAHTVTTLFACRGAAIPDFVAELPQRITEPC